MSLVQIYIEGRRLELFEDEQIKINLSLQNISDISKQYTDFTQTFTVPTSPINNAIFEHFYMNEVDATFDYNLKRNAFIEIDLTPFRSGKIQLNKAMLRDTQSSSYSITFYGKLTNLIDLIKEDKLKDLEFNEYTHAYDGDAVYDRITDDATNYAIRYPLISGRRAWTYGDLTTTDIDTTNGAIIYTELFPAISIDRIFTLIEDKYDIDFQGVWRTDKRWQDCFLLLKKGADFEYTTEPIDLIYTSNSISGTSTLDNTLNKNVILFNYYSNVNNYYDPLTDEFISFFRPEISVSDTMEHQIVINISGANSDVKWFVLIYENDVLINQYVSFGNFTQLIWRREFKGNIEFVERRLKIKIKANQQVPNFTTNITSSYLYTNNLNETLNTQAQFFQGTQALTNNFFDFTNFIPDMTIKDFMAGVMKQFNLVFDPLSQDENNNADLVLRVEPLDSWYQRGGVIDITAFVDVSTIEMEAPKLFKSIDFSYEESKSFLNTEFRNLFNKEYGSLRYIYPYDGQDFNIKLPFENLLQTTFTGTDLQVGLIIDKDLKPYENKPILIYKYDKQTCDFKFDKGASTVTVNDYIPFGQDLSFNSNDITLNFNAENSSLLLEPILRTSFSQYYQGYLNNLFDNKQRLVKLKANLPITLVQNLKLNDRLVINDKRFFINNIELNLTTGISNLELIYDFR
jgi:hypothetical protein